MHDVKDVAPADDVVPAGQFVHEDEPAVAENFPAGQGVHLPPDPAE